MNKGILAIAGSVAALSMLAAVPVFAQDLGGMMGGPRNPMPSRALPGIIGTVSAVNDTTLTVSGKNGTDYSVDASAARVLKVPNTGTPVLISDVHVGDTVLVEGTLNGTNIVAMRIIDGLPTGVPQIMNRDRGGLGREDGPVGTSTRPLPPRPGMMGNELEGKARGVAAIGGKVSAVGSSSFTLEVPKMRDAATTTVTVNTTASTTYMLARSSATFGDIATGNYVMAIGAFSTSTKTLTAVRVQIATTSPMMVQRAENPGQGDQGEGMRPWGSIPTSTAPQNIRGFMASMMQGLVSFFHRNN